MNAIRKKAKALRARLNAGQFLTLDEARAEDAVTITKEETERHVLKLEDHYDGPPSAFVCGKAAAHLRALQRALDEKTERLEKIEAALEWAATRDKWVRILAYAVDANIGLGEHHDGTGPSIANALIALHERAGK